jgi:hypothetical protein
MTIPNFDGLAFPVAKVRYAGPTNSRGSRWVASVYRDRDRTFRATVGYDHALPSGARNALPAALKAFEKARADIDADLREDYVAIPGDFDADTYIFTFVPKRFFA